MVAQCVSLASIASTDIAMHPEPKSIVVEFNNCTMIDPHTLVLFRDLCARFNLPAEVEFTCYDVYPVYFGRYHAELDAKYRQQVQGRSHAEAQTLIRQMARSIENTSLLHSLTIMSICAKFLLGPRAFGLVRNMKKCLDKFTANKDNKMAPVSRVEFMNAEFIVFRHLEFKIQVSKIVGEMLRLTEAVSKTMPAIQFEDLRDNCVKIVRIVFFNRRKFDDIIEELELRSYNYTDANNDLKLGAVAVAYCIMLHYSQYTDAVLDKIVRETYLNESFLRKLTQSVHYMIQSQCCFV